MKKVILTICIGIISIVLVGCDNNNKEVISKEKIHEHCTRNGIVENGSALLSYEIYYTGDVLNLLEAIEEVSSSNSDLLDQYENAYKEIHKHYEGLNYYVTSVVRKDDRVTSTIRIDYDKIDINKLIEIEGEEDNIFEEKIPKASKWKELAKKVGTKCEIVS